MTSHERRTAGSAQRALRHLIRPATRYRVRQRIVETPVLSEQFARINPAMQLARLTDRTVLVLDGFPRSGNSYARSAFQTANGTELEIATHAHTPRVVHLAVRRHIPAVVLIREPDRVIASVLQFADPSFARGVIGAYRRYYRSVLPLAGQVVVAPFEQVTSDFGAVVDRVNAHYGTSFVRYERTPDNEAETMARIDYEARLVVGDADHFEAVVPRPAASRADPAALLARLDPRSRRDLDRARQVYREFLRAAPAPKG